MVDKGKGCAVKGGSGGWVSKPDREAGFVRRASLFPEDLTLERNESGKEV